MSWLLTFELLVLAIVVLIIVFVSGWLVGIFSTEVGRMRRASEKIERAATRQQGIDVNSAPRIH